MMRGLALSCKTNARGDTTSCGLIV